jgi:hypothetical protein
VAIAPEPGQWDARDEVPVISNPIVWALHHPVEAACADSRPNASSLVQRWDPSTG